MMLDYAYRGKEGDGVHLPNTLKILARTFDLRIPLTFTIEDMNTIGNIISDEVSH